MERTDKVMTDSERAIRVLEKLPIVKGKKGQTLKLGDWQKDFLTPLLDTKNPDGTRQYRTGMLFIPRKNGKSTLIASLAIYFLLCEEEYGAEIYSAASTREQAAITYSIARDMVLSSKFLKKRIKVIDSKKMLVREDTKSFYRAISADASSHLGYNVHVAICDEVAVWASRTLWDVLETGTIARRQPLMLAMTTAGTDKTLFGYQLYEYAKKVKEKPSLDKTFLPVIYEADTEDDVFAEETFKKANPSYAAGIIPRQYWLDKVNKAKNDDVYKTTFCVYHLNIWSQPESRFIDDLVWAKCKDSIDLSELKGRDCYIGVDLAAVSDTAAVVYAFPYPDGTVKVIPKIYIPQDRVGQKGDSDKFDYLTAARSGDLTLTDGDVIDYDRILADILAVKDEYNVKTIGVDKWNALHFGTKLASEGLNVCWVRQGYQTLSPATVKLRDLLRKGAIRHNGNTVMAWQAGNCVLEIDPAENIKINKAKSTGRIDSIAALVNALVIMDTPADVEKDYSLWFVDFDEDKE